MYKSSVYKTLALITQIGISIMVPIFLMVIIAIIIKDKLEIDLVLIFLLIGVIVGIRNTVLLIYNFLKEDKMYKNKESEIVKKHKKYIETKNE